MINKNGYYFVKVQVGEEKEDSELVYLSRMLTNTMKEMGTVLIPGDAVFRMTINADNEERFKLGSPLAVLVDMSTIPVWG